MPRGVSRLKHPEMYADGNSGKKSTKVGTGRRVKTGGRTRNVENFSSFSGSTNQGNGELSRMLTLSQIRQTFTNNNQSDINHEIIGKLDQVIIIELNRLVQENQQNDNRAESAVIERAASAPAGTAPQFNPPPPQPGTYTSSARS
jgi:hypothetical protein